MRRTLIAAILFFAAVLACQAVPTASSDQVPVENWTYNALAHLAAKGWIPGMTAQRFMGDWLYNREEMARFVVGAEAAPMPERDRALLSRLAAEFEAEINAFGGDGALQSLEPYRDSCAALPAGWIEGRVERSSGDTRAIGIYDAAGFALSGRYVTFSGAVSDLRRKFDGPAFSRLDTLFVRGKTPNWEWEIGKDYLWWGPGYSGSMALSDNSPSFPLIRLSKDFRFGRHIGNVKLTQFAATFRDSGQRFYLLGRRWEKRFSRKFHLAASETAKTSKTPNPLVFVLPSLYLYQHIYAKDVDAEWNSFVSIDASYRASVRFEGYLDFIIDDMKAPGFLRSQPAWDLDRKAGLLVGGYWPNVVGDGTTSLRAEYIFTDPGTYGPTRAQFPNLAYTHDGFVIGHPVGGNSSAVFLRLDRRFGDGWTAAASYLGRTAREKTGPNPNDTRQLRLLLARDISPSASLIARYESLKLPARVTRFQLGASWAF